MQIHLLSGFLGSGKTTAIKQACYLLMQQGKHVGVITNDQGIKLVDGDWFKSMNIPGRQVVNGCFCCNYNQLDTSIAQLLEDNNPDVIFAESVGSCTDIIATVMKPLLQYRPGAQVTVSTFADVRLLLMLLAGNNLFDNTVNYIYYKQLEEAPVIVINKTDLVSAAELHTVKQAMQDKYAGKTVLYINSTDADSLAQWLQTLNATTATDAALQSLQIDYDIYGAGEAMLAWLDQEIEIYSANNTAGEAANAFMQALFTKTKAANYAIGHLKFLLNGESKVSYTSTSSDDMMTYLPEPKAANTATLLINARVQTSPEQLQALVNDAIEETEISYDCKIVVASTSAFRPGYPRPTHRIL